MKIRKVLNSSVVLAADDSGKEIILMGKGIGYGRKSGEEIVRQPTDRVFVPVSRPQMQRALELFSTTPETILEMTQELVSLAERRLQVKLSPHIYIILADHLQFAVERQKQNIVVTNRVFWEIKNFYRREFAVGQEALEMMCNRFGVSLPEEEAANLAFHIVNASKDVSTHYDAMQAAKLIGDIVNIVKYSTRCHLDTESTHYARFITHVQFFADRFFDHALLESKDDFLYQQIREAYPAALDCAEKVRTFFLQSRDTFLPNEEVAYLAIHVARLTDSM